MKKKVIGFVLFLIISSGLLTACGNTKESNVNIQPELPQIRAICNLATLKCYYHTVGKIIKHKTDDQQIYDFLKKDREVWVEYTGIAKIGIDMTKVKMEIKGDSVIITIPDAELFKPLDVDEDSYTDDSFYRSEDGWLVSNKIDGDTQTLAIKKGQEEMESAVLSNSALLNNAQIRAQKLIKNYIDEIGKVTGVQYKIIWKYEDGTTSTEIPEVEETEIGE